MRLKQANNVLLILILLVNGYIIAAPLLPSLWFYFGNHQHQQQKLQAKIESLTKPKAPPPNQPNQVIIPSIQLDQPILEGTKSQAYSVLNHGIWRWPASSSPDHGGNTVLIGHRYTYTNPRGVFYFLNKLKLNDDLAVIWNNKVYHYQVINIAQVPPTDTAIEANTASSELTMFTCTPLWLPKDRLVVIARLELP